MSWITGIQIERDEKHNAWTFRVEEINSKNENQTTLSRRFSDWDDCVELLHDKIMRWMQDNPCVENWNEDCAEERFNRRDYYKGKGWRTDAQLTA